jgi:hypothetical protein
MTSVGRHATDWSARWIVRYEAPDADVAELVDALDLGSSGVTRGGSSPLIRTMTLEGPGRGMT